MTDALADWLARYQRPDAPEGPTRAYRVGEVLRPGDVLDDGRIGLSVAGGSWATGPLWVDERQSAAAAYYGWFVVHDEYGPCVTEIEDVPLYKIDRQLPA